MGFQLRLAAPALSARVSREAVASTLAKLVASATATSKAELGRVTGLSRTTVDAAVRALLDIGALRIAGFQPSPGRGRPAEVLQLSPDFGLVLVADCGATHASLGVFDLGQQLLASAEFTLRIDSGPQLVLAELAERFGELLDGLGRAQLPRTLVMGLPGPVDHEGGTVVRPPIMPGWDGYPIVETMSRLIGGPTLLENDVNLRALGEARALPALRGPLLYVKVGTGIGVGIVTADGSLLRGADGAAGDVGHVRVADRVEPCSCGNTGCLEAVASIHAIGLALGVDATDESSLVNSVVELIRQQDPRAVRLVKERAEYIGEVVVSLIHFLNPDRVVVGGMLAMASDDLLAAVRSITYSRALPLATRTLTLSRPALGKLSGLAGGVTIGIEAGLDADALADRMLARSPAVRLSR